MQPFLEAVARAYSSHYADLSDFCFIFPNKRSGTFFLKYLKATAVDKVMVAPEVSSVSDFMERMSGRLVDSGLDLLFRLFKTYRDLLGRDEEYVKRFGEPEFESFRSWGEIVLADFDEVDRYCVDHSEIFKNVKDFREISANFLTDEQKQVLEEYFGMSPATDSVEGFWRTFGDPDDMSDIKKKFIYLWEVMAPLYEMLDAELEKDGLATEGGAYRLAARRVAGMESGELPWKKVVFVGFNALSTAEASLFATLRDMQPQIDGDLSYADFIWDATGPVLADPGNSASEFIAADRRNFPSPAWTREFIRKSDRDDLPEKMTMISSPSKSAQVKIAGELMSELRNRLDDKEFRDARVAVVLPDESLLLPLLYSLPENMTDVNLTMGYPLKLTSTVSFVNHLRQLQTRVRVIDGEPGFYSVDLRLFLGQPFAHIAIGSGKIARINACMSKTHRSVVPLSEIKEYSDVAAFLLTPIDRNTPAPEVIDHIDGILRYVDDRLSGSDELIVKSRLDKSHIAVYRDSLRILRQAVARHDINLNFISVFKLVDRLISPVKVTFEGEPLAGLQVMGLLETRALDFDYLIIPSVNEGKLPMKMRKRSFIPNSLRAGYGMPPSNYQESIFSYYFYRLISRAKEVSFIYDARTGAGSGSNEVSRYLHQLGFLYAKDRLKSEHRRFMLGKTGGKDTSVKKSDAVMKRLEPFITEGSGKYLSHSSLRTYRQCPVRFYYEKVVGIRDEEDPGDFLNPMTQGTIVHNMMLRLYLPEGKREKELEPPELVTAEKIRKILDDEEMLRKMIVREINREHFKLKDERIDAPLPKSLELVAPYMLEKVKDVLRYDLSIAPFLINGCEVKYFTSWRLPDGKDVNFTFVIDRTDTVSENGRAVRRIVDYKTGKVKLKNKEEMAFYSADPEAGDLEHALQLMEYATLLNHSKGEETDYKMCIYGTDEMENGAQLPVLGKTVVKGINEVKEPFEKEFTSLLEEIFDRGVDFVQTADIADCTYCPLKQLCGRSL